MAVMTITRASIDSNCTRDIRSWTQTVRSFRHASAGAVVIWSTLLAAQEMEPRSYSAVPMGTNFIVLDYSRSSGAILFDTSRQVAGLQAKIKTYPLRFTASS